MLAKKAVPDDKKMITRDKEAKISSIIDATRRLIETMGYEKVMIRDIAEAADVSVGLIYKYFPGGKFDIIVKGFGAQEIGNVMMLSQPENIDFKDFPGYMRDFMKNYIMIANENKALIKALIAAGLYGGEISEAVKKVDIKDYMAVSEFFGRFNGVDLKGKDMAELLLKWGIAIKGIIIFDLVYPMTFKTDEALADLLVDISLMIWGYKKT